MMIRIIGDNVIHAVLLELHFDKLASAPSSWKRSAKTDFDTDVK